MLGLSASISDVLPVIYCYPLFILIQKFFIIVYYPIAGTKATN